MNINSKIISAACDYYESLGYQLISVPMCIPLESMLVTIPDPSRITQYEHKDGLYYVGSAEQSFVHMYSTGQLQPGKYAALTPCMRSDVPDDIHFMTFLKLELIHIGNDDSTELLNAALTFFSQYDKVTVLSDNPARKDELDIIMNGYEIGSYGHWNMPDGTPFVYATGIAEPRFSHALYKGQQQ